MGLLSNQSCYLIGQIDRCPDGGVQWREDITPILERNGVNVLNPNNKPFKFYNKDDASSREAINELKEQRKFDEIRNAYKYIRLLDLRMVDNADFVIAKMNTSIPTCGSWEEIFWSNRRKIPILYVQEDGLMNIPNWIIFTLPSKNIFTSMADMMSYLDRVDQGLEDHLNRWYFYE